MNIFLSGAIFSIIYISGFVIGIYGAMEVVSRERRFRWKGREFEVKRIK